MSDKPETCDQCETDEPVGGTLFACFECGGHFCGGCMSGDYWRCSDCEDEDEDEEAEGEGRHMSPDAMNAVRRAALEEAVRVCERDWDSQLSRSNYERAAEASRLAVAIRGLMDQQKEKP